MKHSEASLLSRSVQIAFLVVLPRRKKQRIDIRQTESDVPVRTHTCALPNGCIETDAIDSIAAMSLVESFWTLWPVYVLMSECYTGDEGDDPAHNPNVKGVGHASSGRQPVPNEDDGEGLPTVFAVLPLGRPIFDHGPTALYCHFDCDPELQ